MIAFRPGGGPAVREAFAALGVSSLVAAVMTWPTLAHPASTLPEDLGDPFLQTWQVAWDGHALVHQAGHLFDTNAFFPLPDSLAFSDSLLGYAPFGLIGSGPTAALVRYNLLFVASWALASWGAYLLARQLGARRAGAAVAGAVFGYAPWRLSHAGHLNVLSSGPMLLALALIARGHGYRLGGNKNAGVGESQARYAILGWAVAAWQVTLGFGLGLAFLMVLGIIVVVAVGWWLWVGRPALPQRLLIADGVGLGLLLVVTATFSLVYLHAVDAYPEARRTLGDVALFSPGWRGLFTTPANDWLWGAWQSGQRARLSWPPEMTLAPGLLAIVLGVLGLVRGRWPIRRRVLLAGTTVTVAIFALGTTVDGGRFTYKLLYDHVPGWQGVRTPSRVIVWAIAALALLAAVGADLVVAVVARRARVAPRSLDAPLGAVLVALVLVEGIGATPHPSVGSVPAAFTRVAATGRPFLVLPSDDITDERVMWWSTAGFPRMANGGSGVTPRVTSAIRTVGQDVLDRGFGPGEEQALGAYGIRALVVRLASYDASVGVRLTTLALPAGVRRTVVNDPRDGPSVVLLW